MRALKEWLCRLGYDAVPEPLNGDASLRRYFRLATSDASYIVMDATALPESLPPFIDIARRLTQAGIRTPRIIHSAPQKGFALLEDLGSRHLYDQTLPLSYDFRQKLHTLLRRLLDVDTEGLPLYDREFLLFEMELMRTWYLPYRSLNLSKKEHQTLSILFEHIADVVLQQPYGFFVHRDLHSRNIMLDNENNPVVIDFQDARSGPICYDAVSLFCDIYVPRDSKTIRQEALYFRDICRLKVDDERFMQWFDYTALQRYIKVLGIFVRLYERDGKPHYLSYLPYIQRYVTTLSQRYEALSPLLTILKRI